MKNNQNAKINNFCLSIGKQTESPEVIELLGLNKTLVQKANFEFYDFSPNLKIEKNIPDGSITYYKIECYNDDTTNRGRKIVRAEAGWGRVVKHGGSKNYHLERLEIREAFTEDSGLMYNRRIKPYEDSKFLCVTTCPVPFEYLFSIKDTVVCSLGNNVPELVYLNNGDVLAKINGDVKGTPVSDVISSSSVDIHLTGKDSTISSNLLLLKNQKSRPQAAEEGTIIYNKRQKCFEGYDGKKWRKLKWED